MILLKLIVMIWYILGSILGGIGPDIRGGLLILLSLKGRKLKTRFHVYNIKIRYTDRVFEVDEYYFTHYNPLEKMAFYVLKGAEQFWYKGHRYGRGVLNILY